MDETVKAFMDAMMADIKAATSPEVAAKITPLFSKHSALLGKPAAPAGGDKTKKFEEETPEQKRIRQLEAEVRMSRNEKYLDGLKGKVTPAQRPLALSLLEMASIIENPSQVVSMPAEELKFSEEKLTATNVVKKYLEATPETITFNEVAGKESAQDTNVITFAQVKEAMGLEGGK